MLAYPACFEPDESGFTVTFRDVPPAITYGDSLDEAMTMAVDALATALAGYGAPGLYRDVPSPSRPQPGERLVVLPALLAAKVELAIAMNTARVSNSALARRLGVSETVVRRLLSFRHRSHIGTLEAALAELGKALVIEVRDAA